MATDPKPAFQERCARWLLLLTLLHTVPVIWIIPVAGGTAPTVALLGIGVAGLATLEHEGLAMGLMALVPGLLYTAIGWALSWIVGKISLRASRPLRAGVLVCLTLGLLAAVHFPIYIAGGHNSSSSADLVGLFGAAIGASTLWTYWVALHCVLAALFAGALLPNDHALVAYAGRFGRPLLAAAGTLTFGVVVYHNHALFLCRPFAELGFGRAQVCVAKSAGRDQRYWYERAAADGDTEAIAWLIDKTPNRTTRMKWLRKGAEEGDAASQFALYRFLIRTQGSEATAEAERWLDLSAKGDHAPAQMELVERMTKELYRSKSKEQLARRNVWLGRAAELGSRTAMLRLAQHYSDGSMGYPADFARARSFYQELLVAESTTEYEVAFGFDASSYRERVAELDAWETGLDEHDPAVMRLVAKRLLRSQLPGPGVRDRGTALMEQLAEAGDDEVRADLIVMLRTGSGGVDQDVDAAMKWLIDAAEDGDAVAMGRLANNYMSGREGFSVDYPKARHWIDAQLVLYEGSEERDARARLQKLKQDLKYIDRLGGYAGSAMLGSEDLEKLAQRSDAQSRYEHAVQLLVGHGSERRAEAIAGLAKAAEMGHGEAAWRLFQIYDRGFPQEIDKAAALAQLELAVANHHFYATRQLAENYENGKRGLPVDLPKAIALYEGALEAGHDNRYGWNLDPDDFNHYRWLESRLRQARMKLDAQTSGKVTGR